MTTSHRMREKDRDIDV